MPYKKAWALGLVLVFAEWSSAQTMGPPEPIPLPLNPGIRADDAAQAPPVLQSTDNFRTFPRVYVQADYLQFWVNHGPAPTLLTTAPNNGLNNTPTGLALTGGIIGQPGTTTLFTGRDIDYQSFSGFRGLVGVNLDADGFWAVEVGGFILPQRSVNFSAVGNANGTPLLTVPFLDAATGLQNSLDISSQDKNGNPYLSGSIQIHSDIFVWGYDANMVAHSIRTANKSIDLLVGFRMLNLTENLRIDQTTIPAATGNITIQSPVVGQGINNYYNVLANTPVFITDQFGTRNQFYGGQVGGRFNWFLGALSADLNFKVGMGVTHQQATIDGSTFAAAASKGTPPVTSTNLTTPGGVFAQQNNIGSFAQNQFTVVPEIGLNLKYAMTSRLAVRVGYSAMYWSNVARPGAQIDPVLNSKLVPTGALQPFVGGNTAFIPSQEQGRPYFAFRDTAFWAQGINAGLEFTY